MGVQTRADEVASKGDQPWIILASTSINEKVKSTCCARQARSRNSAWRRPVSASRPSLGDRPRAKILVEASTESEWVARCLEGFGHEVVVADPNYAPMYGQRMRAIKTDRRDSTVPALSEGLFRERMEPMGRPSKYSPELRERAVRMVLEHAPTIRRSGRRFDRSPRSWAAASRRCGAGSAKRSAMPASEPGSDDRRAPAAEAARTRELRTEARQRDPAKGVGVFRAGGARPPIEVMVAFIDQHRDDVRGRADLPRAADRPVDVLPAQGAAGGSDAALGAGATRRRAARDHSAHLDRASPGLRAAQGVAADGPREPARGALSRAPVDARTWGCRARRAAARG